MASGSDPLAAHPRARALAWTSLALVVGASLAWSVHPWYDPTNDGSMYIATARSLAAGEGYRYLGLPFLIRPPGFSWLIAPVLALRGTDFFALNLYVSLFGVLGVVLFHFLLRERLGLLLATLVPLALWFSPGYQTLCNQVMSDVPGWTLLVACLLLARRRARHELAGALVLGLAVGLASHVRAGNLLLLPAFLCTGLARELLRAPERAGWRAFALRGAALVLGSALVLVPWSLRNRAVAPPPPADQTLLYSYSSGMWHQDMGDPRSPRVPWREILGRFPERRDQTVQALGARLSEAPAEHPVAVLAWLQVAALVVALLRRRAAEEFLALGTLLVVAFYFGFAARLLLPVFAFALAALVELVRDGTARVAGARAGSALAALGCLTWIGLDWRPREGWDEIRGIHEAYAETARLVNGTLPESARLGAWRGWHHAVYLERPVYSFELAGRRAGRPEACEEIIDRYGIDTVLLTPLGLPEPVRRDERDFAAYVAGRYGGRDRGVVRVR